MIDSMSETLITLTEAARGLPRRRAGRKTNVSTLYRWSVGGCRGVILETLQVGGVRCTSREALQRFFEALTMPAQQRPVVVPRMSAARKRELERVERELDRLLGPVRKEK